MSVENRARLVIEREIQRPVVLHDDGSAAGQYDLRVGARTAPQIAIECVGAVDPIRTETWNVGPAHGPQSLAVAGDWHVRLRPRAKVKPIRMRIEALLRRCETQGYSGFIPVDSRLRRANPELFSALKSLSVSSVHCIRASGTGKVHLGMTGIGGSVDTTDQAVPGWLTKFLLNPERADVLLKLKKSGAAECHVFIPVSFGGVPWNVESYLGSAIELLPMGAPDLPGPVTAAWITYGVNGLRWDGASWRKFDADIPAVDE